MAEVDVKILGSWASSFVMRAQIALNLKHIEYEFLQESIESKSELLLESNPVYKKIPVMIHNGKPICESMIIVQYIDETFTSSGAANAILPSDPYDRAVARFWATYIDDKWLGSLRGVRTAKTQDEKKAAIEEVSTGLELLEEVYQKASGGKGFFGGETIGYLDISFGSCLGWLKVSEETNGVSYIDETRMPGLYAWAKKFCADDAVKEVMPETQKLIEFANMIAARFSLGSSQKQVWGGALGLKNEPSYSKST